MQNVGFCSEKEFSIHIFYQKNIQPRPQNTTFSPYSSESEKSQLCIIKSYGLRLSNAIYIKNVEVYKVK